MPITALHLHCLQALKLQTFLSDFDILNSQQRNLCTRIETELAGCANTYHINKN